MLTREYVLKVLDQARRIDSNFDLFGTKAHQYRLEPPVSEDFVQDVEEKCGFTLPADYRRFITQVGDGGAGPGYGIDQFGEFWKMGYFQEDRFADSHRQGWRRRLARPFSIRPMEPEDVDHYGICEQEFYEEYPERYFVWEKPEDEREKCCSTDGFFGLGTRGDAWDFGIVLNGKKRGQVFTTDNEKGFVWEAYSFEDFYRQYLEGLADVERFREGLERWRARFRRE